MKKRKLHKTILILVMVLVPPYFLVLTDEGTRISDNVMLWLFGRESVKLNLKAIDNGYSRDQILGVFPDVEWNCRSALSSFGDSLCTTEIGSFNDYPSRRLTIFFINDQTNAVKIIYRERYHEQVTGHLIDQFGQPRNVADVLEESSESGAVLEWDTGKGLVLQKKDLLADDEPALFWLAQAQ